MDSACLDGALASFAGDVAADALSEGPSCVLAVVDKRQDTRRRSEVLDHAPTHDDSAALLRRVQTALAKRDVARKGITTDGAARSPAPLRLVFGDVPHHLCPFHVMQELPQGVLKAGATARARLATSKPTLQRGRPASTDKEARRFARTSTDVQQHISDVFQERCVCVQRHLTPSERPRFLHITRGVPQWRTLREIMEPMDAWCDRRCRTQSALGQLKKRRQWVQRFTWMGETFKKVFAPHREHALTCLDDTLLPATSHAVERGNRRHRTRHKSVDRIRSQVG